MSHFVRILKINRVFLRYRLDSFFRQQPLPWAIKILLAPLGLLPQPKASRGKRLRAALEELGPVFVKFGQLLSTRPDLIPADICEELEYLQDRVPPFSGEQFVGIVEKTLGGKIDTLFQSFEHQPLASASVAQVHAAVLPDGREVVVKVVRPGIEAVIEQDCRLLLGIAHVIERYLPDGRRLRPLEVARDYRTTILDELSLQREAANTVTLRRNFENSALLYVPEIYWPYCREQVLVMERIYATPVTDVKTLEAAGTNFKILAERGVEIFFTQVFEHNFFHADMHPGNIFVDASEPTSPRYLAVDCAIIGSLTERDQYFLARTLLAVFRRDYRQVAELHVLAGWVSTEASIIEVEAAIRTVCEPIFQRPLKEISCGHLLVSLFRTARRFDAEVQPSLVLLQKTLLNIEGLGRQLYPDLDLWATAHPFLERWVLKHFSPRTLLDRLRKDGPEWLEQFPEIPQLIHTALQQASLPEHGYDRPGTKDALSPSTKRQSKFKPFGALLAGLGIGGLFIQASAMGHQSLGLIVVATGVLLLLLS
ncbi:MAG TPA: ubiquinone biosynthesis regulatory protein kinase UbiB [Porticoccaceae bacterium]|nr:ubiquinone biosynthesis regulatory protein kinase UbiB [Porticoccaceae bacterium]